ncbi:hypothetical protein HPP92_011091 [Vanilla planifolia]|uniref:Uncharacterized protein n=1 Tax=Vanilla planifolia TaxID=51239 RepID=A0A835V0E7_VANPL|nr:hypothetical protein HPP92_011091 [Vanilla planifolia]
MQAELVIMEQNMLDVFAMVESYCHLLAERTFLLQHEKECPEELREAAAGLAYAASRCGDLPELRECRSILSSWFGKEFTAAAAELRNNCGVNAKIVQKLSTRQPSLERRMQVMEDIAMKNGIKLEFGCPLSEASKVNRSPSQHSKIQKWKKVTQDLDIDDCDDDDELTVKVREKYNDAGSAAEATFVFASHAAVAAKAAVELFRSESNGKGSGGDNESTIKKHEQDTHDKQFVAETVENRMQPLQTSKWVSEGPVIKQGMARNGNSTTSSNSSSNDNGSSKLKMSSLEMNMDKPRDDVTVFDESDDCA